MWLRRKRYILPHQVFYFQVDNNREEAVRVKVENWKVSIERSDSWTVWLWKVFIDWKLDHEMQHWEIYNFSFENWIQRYVFDLDWEKVEYVVLWKEDKKVQNEYDYLQKNSQSSKIFVSILEKVASLPIEDRIECIKAIKTLSSFWFYIVS
jgi:hypothetical protein